MSWPTVMLRVNNTIAGPVHPALLETIGIANWRKRRKRRIGRGEKKIGRVLVRAVHPAILVLRDRPVVRSHLDRAIVLRRPDRLRRLPVLRQAPAQ